MDLLLMTQVLFMLNLNFSLILTPSFVCNQTLLPSQGRPFFFTFFVSNDVKLHSTTAEKADEIVQKHLGTLLLPPASVERYNEIGPYVTQDLEV